MQKVFLFLCLGAVLLSVPLRAESKEELYQMVRGATPADQSVRTHAITNAFRPEQISEWAPAILELSPLTRYEKKLLSDLWVNVTVGWLGPDHYVSILKNHSIPIDLKKSLTRRIRHRFKTVNPFSRAIYNCSLYDRALVVVFLLNSALNIDNQKLLLIIQNFGRSQELKQIFMMLTLHMDSRDLDLLEIDADLDWTPHTRAYRNSNERQKRLGLHALFRFVFVADGLKAVEKYLFSDKRSVQIAATEFLARAELSTFNHMKEFFRLMSLDTELSFLRLKMLCLSDDQWEEESYRVVTKVPAEMLKSLIRRWLTGGVFDNEAKSIRQRAYGFLSVLYLIIHPDLLGYKIMINSADRELATEGYRRLLAESGKSPVLINQYYQAYGNGNLRGFMRGLLRVIVPADQNRLANLFSIMPSPMHTASIVEQLLTENAFREPSIQCNTLAKTRTLLRLRLGGWQSIEKTADDDSFALSRHYAKRMLAERPRGILGLPNKVYRFCAPRLLNWSSNRSLPEIQTISDLSSL